jgi:predicted DNA-binding transcriptional regulator AlpA
MTTTKDAIELLTDKQVAKSLNVSRAAVRRWRRVGGGPGWVRLEKRLVRYPVDELRRYIERQAEVR